MRVNIVMPKMGESINEGTIIKWHKKKGDKVQKDEIIFEISTDKVDTEIPSSEEGTLVEIKAFEQETVEVGEVVAVIETESDAASNADQEEQKSEEKVPSTKQVGGDLIDIPMPKMGESVMEGTIIKWYKKVGDNVESDETLFEISTDKVDTEVPSPVKGVLAEIITNENETVEVGEIVARIKSSTGISYGKIEDKKAEPQKETAVAAKEETTKKSSSTAEIYLDKPVSDRFYSPVVLNIARKENIPFDELERIGGSGVKGRLTKKDLFNYLEARKSGSVTKPRPTEYQSKPSQKETVKFEASETQTTSFGNIDVVPMDNIRSKIMEHMVKSRDTSVHVTAMIEVDMTQIHNYIERNKDTFQNNEGIKLTYMPFISYAAINALKQFPFVNASIEGNNILVKKFINLGIAVAVEPNGLIVPNIKNADERNIRGLAKAINQIGQKARNKGLSPDDISGGTFTITNYGVFGSLFGTPIINQPEVAILGVGTVTKKPVVVEVNGVDSIAIKPMMYLSLAHDHRLVDGMLGGRFLKAVKDTLENFDINLV
ncbi:MAG: 2-oxoglutarate dehydrogenase, E2 component, dihydrolipoamide succinyltransferase [Melioribacteraceae bacterium]|nr:2-oxoglutarate dehydrogenase, E2 component, dihydrolipoamide succinyltransferase [Melioribacteraceae bacterium]